MTDINSLLAQARKAKELVSQSDGAWGVEYVVKSSKFLAALADGVIELAEELDELRPYSNESVQAIVAERDRCKAVLDDLHTRFVFRSDGAVKEFYDILAKHKLGCRVRARESSGLVCGLCHGLEINP